MPSVLLLPFDSPRSLPGISTRQLACIVGRSLLLEGGVLKHLEVVGRDIVKQLVESNAGDADVAQLEVVGGRA